MCSDPISVHCSTGQDRMNFSLPCVALQNKVTACWCHYKYTLVYFFNIQVLNVPSPLHCSIGQGEMHSSLPSCSAKQADSYVVERLCGVRCLITNALQHWSEQKAFLIARSCSAKQADSIAMSHHQYTIALVKTKCFPHSPDLHCKTG